MSDKTIELNGYSDEIKRLEITKDLKVVFESLKDKGYEPYDQIIGYLLSGDPSYIPRYNNSRNLLKSHSRDAILDVLLRKMLEDE